MNMPMWLTGFLFTWGFITHGDDENNSFSVVITAQLLCLLAWPLLLGNYVAKLIRERLDHDD